MIDYDQSGFVDRLFQRSSRPDASALNHNKYRNYAARHKSASFDPDNAPENVGK